MQKKSDVAGLLAALTAILCCILTFADRAHAATNSVTHYYRSIGKEPAYQSTPKYCLITIGNNAETKVWMVEDGKRLFVDKNANGDLTDDGPPLEPTKVRHLDANRWDFDYVLDAITPTNGSRHTDFVLRRWNYDKTNDSYGLSFSVDGRMPMYAGWFGTFWSTNREQAPVLHFGGPLTPVLLRKKEFMIGETHHEFNVGFINPGSGKGAETWLSIDAIPRTLVPTVTIEWPTASGSPPLRTTQGLYQRCCYWDFYTIGFDVPKGAVVGKAKVIIDLPSGPIPIELTTEELTVPVVAPAHDSASAR
jgi:hypothetical protein